MVSLKGALCNALVKGRVYTVNEDDVQWLRDQLIERSREVILLNGEADVQG